MTKRTVRKSLDLVLIGMMVAHTTDPRVVLQERLPCCNTHGEVCATAGTCMGPGREGGREGGRREKNKRREKGYSETGKRDNGKYAR